ncbi:FprA family A-type flavoprotein [Guggenheimella bovis]
MHSVEIKKGIHALSLNVEEILFEGMWDLHEGVTLNSYVVKGEKTAVIDGFIGWDGVPETLYAWLKELDIEVSDVDYLVVNHMEPDHSGWIPSFCSLNPKAKIYAGKESAALIKAFFGIEENVVVVSDGDTLDLGGRTLSFHKAPNVHWPDTFMCLDSLTKTLFCCDNFGAFGTLDKITSSAYTMEELSQFEDGQKRYFSNILMTFSPMVQKAIEKAKALEPETIAPGHGLIWDDKLEKIFSDYERYAAYQKNGGEEKIAIVWGSMYGMTEKMVHFVESLLEREGISYESMEVPATDLGTVLEKSFDCKGLIVAAPTYEYKMFPMVASTLEEMGKKRLYNKTAIYLGSYGWSGGALKEYNEIVERNRMNFTTLQGIEFNGTPTDESKKQVEEAVMELIKSLRS